jgi:hypothetical protein
MALKNHTSRDIRPGAIAPLVYKRDIVLLRNPSTHDDLTTVALLQRTEHVLARSQELIEHTLELLQRSREIWEQNYPSLWRQTTSKR